MKTGAMLGALACIAAGGIIRGLSWFKSMHMESGILEKLWRYVMIYAGFFVIYVLLFICATRGNSGTAATLKPVRIPKLGSPVFFQ